MVKDFKNEKYIVFTRIALQLVALISEDQVNQEHVEELLVESNMSGAQVIGVW